MKLKMYFVYLSPPVWIKSRSYLDWTFNIGGSIRLIFQFLTFLCSHLGAFVNLWITIGLRKGVKVAVGRTWLALGKLL